MRCLPSRPCPVAEHPLSEADIVGFSGKFESAEGTAILFGDQGRIRVKFTENGPSLPLVYLGDGAFTAGPNMISKAYLKNGRAQGAALYVRSVHECHMARAIELGIVHCFHGVCSVLPSSSEIESSTRHSECVTGNP